MVATVAGIHLGIDTHANRPAANTVPDGSLYSCSTHSLIYRSNFAGNSWATWATLAGTGSAVIPNMFIGSIPPWLAISAPTALTANRAMLYRVTPSQDVTVTTAYWNCTASAGNLDFGIYNADLSSRLGSTGSFASPGTGNRSQALTAPVALTAGNVYYVAMAVSSTTFRSPQITTATAVATGGWNMFGREEASLPLPASIASADAWEDSTVHPCFYFK